MPRNRWPFSKMVVGQTVRISQDIFLARTAAHVTGAQKGWKFSTRMVRDPVGGEHLEVTRLSTSKVDIAAIREQAGEKAAKRVESGEEGAIPECMRPDGQMPRKYMGKYPFEALDVGQTMTFTRHMVSMEALGRIFSAACNAGTRAHATRKYSVSRGLDKDDYMWSWVAVTRVR